MSSEEHQLNQDINELQRFVHNTRRQVTYSQSNLRETLGQYYNILNASTQQLAQ